MFSCPISAHVPNTATRMVKKWYSVPSKNAKIFTSPKIWPNYGQDWNIKEKRFCVFAHFELLAKSLWCPEQDLNLHSFRNTHLKRARLPIPPPGHLVAFFESKRRRLNVFFLSCPGQDLNLHRLWRLPPQSSVSTNSTTWAKLSSFSLESGCKGTNIFRYGKTFFQLRVKSQELRVDF